MKKLILGFFALAISSCTSTHSNTPLSNGQFVATFTDKLVGADGSSFVSNVMKIAAEQCGSQKIKVVSLSNTGMAIGTFPSATLIYQCE